MLVADEMESSDTSTTRLLFLLLTNCSQDEADRERTLSVLAKLVNNRSAQEADHSPPVGYHSLPDASMIHGLEEYNQQLFAGPSPVASHRALDRSISEPAGKNRVNPARYKTEMCRQYQEMGRCRYGEKCQFAHGDAELRDVSRHPKYKTEMCRTFHSTGFCPYGHRCHFIHKEEERNTPIAGHLFGRAHSVVSPPTFDLADLLCNKCVLSGGSVTGGSPDPSPLGSLIGSPSSHPHTPLYADDHVKSAQPGRPILSRSVSLASPPFMSADRSMPVSTARLTSFNFQT